MCATVYILFPQNSVGEKFYNLDFRGENFISACVWSLELKTESIYFYIKNCALRLHCCCWDGEREISDFLSCWLLAFFREFFFVNSAAESESFIYAWDMDCWLLSVALEAAAAAAAAAAMAWAWSDAPGDGVPWWWCAGFSNRKLCGNPKSWDHWIRGQ